MIRVILIIFIFLSSGLAIAQDELKTNLDPIFSEVADKYEVPVELLKSICWSESHFDEKAFNFNDGNEGNSAFGVCQVLYSTALDNGMKKDLGCLKDYRTNLKGRNYKGCRLFGPLTSITYSAKYLKYQLKRYDNSWISAIAAYNTGSLKPCTTGKVHQSKDGKVVGKCHKGSYVNEEYINGVLKYLPHKEAAKLKLKMKHLKHKKFKK